MGVERGLWGANQAVPVRGRHLGLMPRHPQVRWRHHLRAPVLAARGGEEACEAARRGGEAEEATAGGRLGAVALVTLTGRAFSVFSLGAAAAAAEAGATGVRLESAAGRWEERVGSEGLAAGGAVGLATPPCGVSGISTAFDSSAHVCCASRSSLEREWYERASAHVMCLHNTLRAVAPARVKTHLLFGGFCDV